MDFSRREAQAIMLAAQGLLRRPDGWGASKDDVLAASRRMGALQIDTINVVARSPYLVLWSRLGAYEPSWLNELLAEGRLFEYWSHAACFLPIEDYGLYRRRMLDDRGRSRAWIADHAELVSHVRHAIATRGPVRSAEWERTDGRVGTWWDWKPEKLALEHLFYAGELMIARRDRNFQRVYDLQERVLPGWNDEHTPTPEAVRRGFVLKSVLALGVALARWVPDYFRLPKQGIAPLLRELEREGILVPARIEGLDGPAYVHRDGLPLIESVLMGAARTDRTTLLSPFDPLVWDRARALELWGFHYRIETYTPAARRRYGYFSLPVLHAGQLVGRLDAKAHRKQGLFEVRALHLEPGAPAGGELLAALAATLRDCAAWHGTPEIRVLASDPPALAEQLAALQR